MYYVINNSMIVYRAHPRCRLSYGVVPRSARAKRFDDSVFAVRWSSTAEGDTFATFLSAVHKPLKEAYLCEVVAVL